MVELDTDAYFIIFYSVQAKRLLDFLVTYLDISIDFKNIPKDQMNIYLNWPNRYASGAWRLEWENVSLALHAEKLS